ncbi:hypothetical protein C8R44DRAFT_748001 [Mycena epipterygia]|nr:hypothetical protein C8R44DRAFT_748001 [Mycena epipterygia]
MDPLLTLCDSLPAVHLTALAILTLWPSQSRLARRHSTSIPQHAGGRCVSPSVNYQIPKVPTSTYKPLDNLDPSPLSPTPLATTYRYPLAPHISHYTHKLIFPPSLPKFYPKATGSPTHSNEPHSRNYPLLHRYYVRPHPTSSADPLIAVEAFFYLVRDKPPSPRTNLSGALFNHDSSYICSVLSGRWEQLVNFKLYFGKLSNLLATPERVTTFNIEGSAVADDHVFFAHEPPT